VGMLLVTQCTIVPIRKNIGSIKFISGEAAEPDMNFIDPIFSVLGQLYTVQRIYPVDLIWKKMESEVKYGDKTMTNSISHGKLKDEIK
jgi:hypothetical protein